MGTDAIKMRFGPDEQGVVGGGGRGQDDSSIEHGDWGEKWVRTRPLVKRSGPCQELAIGPGSTLDQR